MRQQLAAVTLAAGLLFQADADAARIVYLAEQRYSGLPELFLVDTEHPGVTTQLNKPLPQISNGRFSDGVTSFAISRDGTRVAYSADQTQVGNSDLYLVDLAAPGTWTRVGDLPANYRELRAKFSLDGRYLAFTASDENFALTQIYLVELANPGTAVRLNGTLAPNGAVSTDGFEFTPDSTHIVYTAGELESMFELYAVELSEPGESVRLNAPGGSVGDSYEGRFQLGGFNNRVFYSAVWKNPGVRELHVVSVDQPGQPTTLNAPLQPAGYVFDFDVSADGDFVTYTADQETDGKQEVYLVETEFPGVATKINGPVQNGAGLAQLSLDGRRVFYAGDEERTVGARDLYSRLTYPDATRVRVNAPLPEDSDIDTFVLSNDGTHVVYRTVQRGQMATDLMLADLSQPGTAIKLNGPLPTGFLESRPILFSPRGDAVAFIAGESVAESIQELFLARLNDPGTSFRLNSPLAPGGIVSPNPGAFAFVPELTGFHINSGITDAWYDPATNGQGFFITVLPETRQMFLAWFTYDGTRPPPGTPAVLGEPGHRWFTAQGHYYRDQAGLSMYLTQGGVFDSDEPTAGTSSLPVGSIGISWADCRNALLWYSLSQLGQSGVLELRRLVSDNVPLCEALAENPYAPPAAAPAGAEQTGFRINSGISDAWYNPETNGQGFSIVVWEDIETVFLSWFTFDTERPPPDVTAELGEPGHRWLTAQGPFSGDTASLTVYLTTGGIFDSRQPVPGPPQAVGTMEIAWTGCNAGIVTYDLPGLGLFGDIPVQRITLENVPACEAGQAAP